MTGFMSLKKFGDNECGFTYTIEAILGVALILGTVIFATGNLPYVAQKTGEHSKVQLMNIGRDVLDLTVATPIYETCPDCLEGEVYRNYTLVADKKFVAPGEDVTFTVYKLGLTDIYYQNLYLTSSTLGLNNEAKIGIINGTVTKNFSIAGEYNIRAVDDLDNQGNPKNNWSNYVTINVGYYYLDSDVNGISDAGSKIVNGVVYNSSGVGIPNLTIQILDYQYNIVPGYDSVTKTSYGRIIENFENASDWTSSQGANEGSNSSTFTQDNRSLSVNGTSSFWIQRINSSGYKLDYNDILSFDFDSPTSAKTNLEIVLSNSSGSTNKFTWSNISVNKTGWNKINLKLTNSTDITNLCCHPNYPFLNGTIGAAPEVDTIKITVSNVSANQNYLFDNLTTSAGKFLFTWTISGGGSTGTYYLRAIDSSGNVSNTHRIVYSNDALIYSSKDIIYEGDTVTITLIPAGSLNKFNTNQAFNINQQFYGPGGLNSIDRNKIFISDPIQPQQLQVTLTANTSGDYYIFYGNTGQGNGQDPANGAKTNTILLRVLPRTNTGPTGDTCVDKIELNNYMRKYIPPNVNYNLYLLGPTGQRFLRCTKFQDGQLTNGYPTDEAVTVNKLLHIKYPPTNIDNILEMRMVLWYK
jgi:hypothetical protein